jgi:hypothetical protein
LRIVKVQIIVLRRDRKESGDECSGRQIRGFREVIAHI